MPIDYFLWVVRSKERLVVVDTGFDAEMARKRHRTLLREPSEGLALIGIDAKDVREVVITHMHNDHLGTTHRFPKAMFHIQDEEMSYATGRHMGTYAHRRPYEVDHVAEFVKLVYRERVVFHGGDESLDSGLQLCHIGGHTAGIQAVRVYTKRGWIVLASDAAPYYENVLCGRCFPTVYHPQQMVDGYARLHQLADSPEHIIPGHDPLVLCRYPPPTPSLSGIVAKLDEEPIH